MGDALEKKTSPNIWWIRKVVVPLHSQLKRKGFPSELGDPTGRKCLIRFLERDVRRVALRVSFFSSFGVSQRGF